MKIVYLDCSSGISGDMCLGALVDAGIPLKRLEKELKKIPVRGYKLSARKIKRSSIAATKVDVLIDLKSKKQNSKKWKDIENLIKKSSLNPHIKNKGLRIFRNLFEAEAKVHGEPLNKIHLHELGAVDCIVDIFGTIIGLNILGIEKVYASAVNTGNGFVKTKHGILPVPAPATAELLKRALIYSDGTDFELTTPTGAAILKETVIGFGDMPEMIVEKIGTGAGGQDFKSRPNVLRMFIGKDSHGLKEDSKNITVIETNIDDMNPQIYEHVIQRLFEAGALDVYLMQIIMKKSRPGIKLTVLCNNETKEDLMRIILKETTAIGLRFYEAGRKTLAREIKEVNTKLGKVRIKISRLENEIVHATPEYEDCKRIAKKLKMPLLEVIKEINLRAVKTK
ncbi:MAG: nickel pincer cofactor biosynthesis protein LarC [Nitrospiraceae bacterium]|nr:nickel pincer cofactor biosynthesis protein LarC [Nitrospiraceae bacterium]